MVTYLPAAQQADRSSAKALARCTNTVLCTGYGKPRRAERSFGKRLCYHTLERGERKEEVRNTWQKITRRKRR